MKFIIIYILGGLLLLGCRDKITDIPSKGVWIDINSLPHHGPCYLIDGELYVGEIIMRDKDDISHILDTIKENIPPIDTSGMDLKTFKFLLSFDHELFYAKDKNKVYYPEMSWLDAFTCVDSYADSLYTLKDADPKTFKYLGDGYAVDKKNMYYKGWRIHWNDSLLNRFR